MPPWSSIDHLVHETANSTRTWCGEVVWGPPRSLANRMGGLPAGEWAAHTVLHALGVGVTRHPSEPFVARYRPGA